MSDGICGYGLYDRYHFVIAMLHHDSCAYGGFGSCQVGPTWALLRGYLTRLEDGHHYVRRCMIMCLLSVLESLLQTKALATSSSLLLGE